MMRIPSEYTNIQGLTSGSPRNDPDHAEIIYEDPTQDAGDETGFKPPIMPIISGRLSVGFWPSKHSLRVSTYPRERKADQSKSTSLSGLEVHKRRHENSRVIIPQKLS